ncbi:tetratricopeptide repeat protein [Methanospirillum hungatei]|jgi:tetratricopeptide (TPR) repeat protein|uniref:tetratricopeptide repeat protein n=1 Tax=Methanospirillum hungatei TaxID=2203 RepID=UPI0009D14A22|nr:tetratricopeptide repeat protein [Methanospirillum hungatei]MBP9007089.1 tetratricopeptide repeat protein [Methanospirillum sp.]OQA60652.1 MAG: cellulose synthase subunit BcsC [Euryarchaeota archaeon ADurb.Bin294]HOW03661.1 tetratricopeptide repeat protein [Methanospirillum hungatei]
MILNGNVSPVTLSILCIIFLLVSGASASPAEIEKLLAEGVDMYNSGDRDTALQLFESVVLTDPSWPYGWLWKGTVLADMGRDMEAEDAFKTGRCLLNPDACDDSSSPPSSEVREVNRAEGVLYPVNANNGESIISHHQESYPGYMLISDPVQLEREGDRYMELGKYDAALQSYLLAEQIDPGNPTYSRKIGDVYRAKGDFNSALDSWNRSLQNETDPGVSDSLRKKRSDAFSTLNMPDKAIQELEGLKLSGNDPLVYSHMGELYSKLQDYAHAEESFQNSISFDPTNIDASLGLAEARIRQGKMAKAKETLDFIPKSALTPEQMNLLERLKREHTYYQQDKTSDLSFLFSHPELFILTGIGIFGIFYFRDKIFR